MSVAFQLLPARMLRSAGLAVLVLALLVALTQTPRAYAELAQASLIDGPSSTILEVDGAAMAADGSGGILYRKLVPVLVNGRPEFQPHLFVARFLAGAWQAPIEVDAGQPFGASFPTIAAGDSGRLLVVWAEPWAFKEGKTEYELMSAELDPGAEHFGPAIQIDPKGIGNGTAAFPSLAINPAGQAFVAYRVVTNTLEKRGAIPQLRPGDELVSVRVARYNGEGLPWTSLGAINAHPSLTMRHPSAGNAPSIGITLNGNAVVAWQEPNSSGTSQILARRIFGSHLGNVLQVSPENVGGRAVTSEADAPTVAVNGLGEARISYRLAGGAGSPYGSARIMLATLPSEVAVNGAKLEPTVPVGGAPALGAPSVAIDEAGAYRLAYAAAGATQLLGGDDYHPSSTPAPLGPTSLEDALTSINPAGGGVTVWPSVNGTAPVIDARQDFAGGAWQFARLSAPLSGPVGPPFLGGSGQGDALIAFSQGPPGQQQVMAAVAKAPPGKFLAFTPIGWVKGSSATVSWEAAPEAFGASTYSVLVDGRVVAHGLTGLSAHLSARGLGDGAHRLQVRATDSLGQETVTAAASLKIDANPPQVSVQHLGRGQVRVRVVDHASGAVPGDTLIAFGDGSTARDRLSASHTYARSGRYVISVHSQDRVGNRLIAHIQVQVQ